MRGRLCDSGSVLGLPHVAKLLRAEKSQDGRQVVCLRPKRLARPVPEIKPGKIIIIKGKNWTHQRRKYANQHEALISGMYCRSQNTVAPVPVEASEVMWVKNDVEVAVPGLDVALDNVGSDDPVPVVQVPEGGPGNRAQHWIAPISIR